MVYYATRSEREVGSAREELGTLDTLSSEHSSGIVRQSLTVVREHLGMDIAFVAEFSGDHLEFRSLEGDAESFGFEEGGSIPLDGSYCRRLADGRIAGVIPEARDDGRVEGLEITSEADIGSYVGAPLKFSDGRVYGTLCGLSHSSDPSLKERDAEFVRVLARLVSEQLEREEMERRTRQLEVKAAGADALVAALEARDGYTGEHSREVVELSAEVARGLGLSGEEVEEVAAALLHDVGKMGIPDAILRKPGPLSDEEREAMRRRPEIGGRIVASIEGLSHLAPIIRAEHERWDGKGYPDGLTEEEIPLASRIVLACDAFHAMISDRPYRKAMPLEEALRELEKNAAQQFELRVVGMLVDATTQVRVRGSTVSDPGLRQPCYENNLLHSSPHHSSFSTSYGPLQVAR